MNCIFCKSPPGLSREHLISRPVAEAFAIKRDRDLSVIEHGQVTRSVRLEQLSVRLPCKRCNSSWMNQLERAMPSVAGWMYAGDQPIDATTVEVFRRWLLKSYIVTTAMDAGIRHFGSNMDWKVPPEPTRAGQLYRGDDRAFTAVTIGVARRTTPFPNNFAYSIGNPTVVPVGPQRLNRRCSGTAMFALGRLQAWIVVPFAILTPTVTLPGGFRGLRTGDQFEDLLIADERPDVDQVVIDVGPTDWLAVFDALAPNPSR